MIRNVNAPANPIIIILKIEKVCSNIHKAIILIPKDIKNPDIYPINVLFEDLGISTIEKHGQQIITNLDIRSNKILLPKVVNDIAKFHEKEDIVIKVDKGKIFIEKM